MLAKIFNKGNLEMFYSITKTDALDLQRRGFAMFWDGSWRKRPDGEKPVVVYRSEWNDGKPFVIEDGDLIRGKVEDERGKLHDKLGFPVDAAGKVTVTERPADWESPNAKLTDVELETPTALTHPGTPEAASADPAPAAPAPAPPAQTKIQETKQPPEKKK